MLALLHLLLWFKDRKAYIYLLWVRLFWNDAERRGNNGLARCQRETTEDGASFGM
jgi:hypothetical protein